jgi:hypothetical protein
MTQQLRKRFYPSFDCLESRTVLAGNVTISSSNGILSILGDAAANDIRVQSTAPGSITITGLNGTTLNGGAGPLTITNFNKNLSIRLNDGDDSVELIGLHVNKQANIDLGAGNNTLQISNTTFEKEFTIRSGDGNDAISLTNVTLDKEFLLFTNGGADTVTLSGVTGLKGEQIQTGAGADNITITGSTFAKAVGIDAGAGDDQIILADTVLGTGSQINGGPGNDLLGTQNVNLGRNSHVSGVETPETSLAPVAANDTLTVAAGASATVNLAANDQAAGGTTLNLGSIIITTPPQHGTVVVHTDGTVTYTNTDNTASSDSFRYTIANNLGQVSNAATVNVTITGSVANVPPIANSDAFTVLHGSTVTLNILANDTDANNNINPASIVIVQQPTQGTLTVHADGTVTYVSNANSTGTDTFTYTVADTGGLISNVATVSLSIS